MTGERKPPWTLPAKSLVLYLRKGRWRFALHQESGDVMDGELSDFSTRSVEAAQGELLRRVEEMTDLRYSATWVAQDDEMWVAELNRLV